MHICGCCAPARHLPFSSCVLPGLQVSQAEAKELAPRYVVVTGMSAAEDVQDVTQ